MVTNILLWAVIAIFVGLVGYKIELNKDKNIWSNVLAAFVGVYLAAFVVHVFTWTEAASVNPIAAIAGIAGGFVAVKVEDYIWLRV